MDPRTSTDPGDGGAADRAVRHVYVHVPFCPQICPFCSFHVLRRTAGAVEAYLDRLLAEADDWQRRAELAGWSIAPSTTYLGGGTPSMLRTAELRRLLDGLSQRWGLGSEVTLEIHPSTVSASRVAAWLDAGVTRFSVGVESTDDAVLTRLGRTHDATTALAAVDTVQSVVAGHPGVVVGADLMVAIDGQDHGVELRRIVELGVDHVSVYTLTIEPGTPFEAAGVRVDEDRALDAFDQAADVLAAAGLPRYEISNYARPGAECRHNLGYWRSAWWLGLGPSAAGHLPPALAGADEPVAVRSVNQPLPDWLASAPATLDQRFGFGWAVDALVTGLRPVTGCDVVALSARCGVDLVQVCHEPLSELVAEGLVVASSGRWRATDRGARVLDRVTERLVDPLLAAASDEP